MNSAMSSLKRKSRSVYIGEGGTYNTYRCPMQKTHIAVSVVQNMEDLTDLPEIVEPVCEAIR